MSLFEDALTIEEIFSIQNILIYLVIVNILGFLIMFIDKRKAKRDAWRIPEKTLFIVSMIGGSLGTLIGMYVFRHKTKKLKFKIGFPTILVIHLILIIYIVVNVL